MTTPEALGALADRVEREKPSYMLDALIEREINPDKKVLFDAGSVQPPIRKAVYGLLRDFPLENWNDWYAIAQHIGAEDYTTSLDSAVTLVPEGFGYKIATDDWDAMVPPPDLSPSVYASLHNKRRTREAREEKSDRLLKTGIFANTHHPARAATAAQALTAAALRARAALIQTQGGEE